jgi:hypothetical protein
VFLALLIGAGFVADFRFPREDSRFAYERGREDERGGAGWGDRGTGDRREQQWPPERARHGGRDGGEADGWSPERAPGRQSPGNRYESDAGPEGDYGGGRREADDGDYGYAAAGTGRERGRAVDEEHPSSEGAGGLKYRRDERMPSPASSGHGVGTGGEAGIQGRGAGASADELLRDDYNAAVGAGAVPPMDSQRGEDEGA